MFTRILQISLGFAHKLVTILCDELNIAYPESVCNTFFKKFLTELHKTR